MEIYITGLDNCFLINFVENVCMVQHKTIVPIFLHSKKIVYYFLRFLVLFNGNVILNQIGIHRENIFIERFHIMHIFLFRTIVNEV